jgi:hypothetical protein
LIGSDPVNKQFGGMETNFFSNADIGGTFAELGE